jgi:hypothetical protein
MSTGISNPPFLFVMIVVTINVFIVASNLGHGVRHIIVGTRCRFDVGQRLARGLSRLSKLKDQWHICAGLLDISSIPYSSILSHSL